MTGDVDLAFALGLADLAASISLEPFRTRSYSVQIKPDGSPVTNVDVAVEQALRARIAERWPRHAVVGEELGQSGSGEWCWYLDPIDGTAAYINGEPRWSTLIALGRRGEIVLGVVDHPARGERWWGQRGGGAFRDGRPVHVSAVSELGAAVVSDDWHAHIASGEPADHPLVRLAAHCARVLPNQGHSALSVAAGEADVAVAIGGHAWDFAPLKVILEEAGGTFTDLAGGPSLNSGASVATNGLLHAQVLDVLDGVMA